MNVTAKLVFDPQRPRDLHHLLHSVVGIADDAGTEEKTFDVIASVEIEREPHHFVGGETRAADIAGDAVDTVKAVVNAVVREQDFQQRDASPIGRVAVADSGAGSGPEALTVPRIPFRGPA